MKNRSLRGRQAALAALVAVACSLTMLSVPASAVHVPLRVGTAHLFTHWSGITHVIPSEAPRICVPEPDATEMTVTLTHDPATATTHIGAGALLHNDEVDMFVGGANTRVSYQTVNTGAGSINGAGFVTQTVHMQVTVRTCAGTQILCVVSATGTLTGTTTGGQTLTTGDQVSISGSSNPITVAVGCNALIRSQLLGSTVTLALTMTAV